MKRMMFVVALLLIATVSFGGEWWARNYGDNPGTADLSLGHLVQLSDGSFMSGQGISCSLTKFNSTGTAQWIQIFRDPTTIQTDGSSIALLPDGSIIDTGRSQSDIGAGNYDIWIAKIDATTGAVEWQKFYGWSGSDQSNTNEPPLVDEGTGDIFVFGNTESQPLFGGDLTNPLVMRITNSGDVVSGKVYGTDLVNYRDYLNFERTSDGGFIACGYTRDAAGTVYAGLVVKIDASGVVEWARRYDSPGRIYGRDAREVSDGYILTASASGFGGIGYDFWVVRLDAAGDIIWEKTYGGNRDDELPRFVSCSNGIVIAGITDSFGAGGRDIWALKLDLSGTILWEKTYGGSADEVFLASFLAARELSDGSLAFTTSTLSWTHTAGRNDALFLKTDADGNIGTSCSLIGTSAAQVRDTSVTVSVLTILTADVTPIVNQANLTTQRMTPATSTQCTFTGCTTLTCGSISVDAKQVCDGTPQTFTAVTTGGELPLTVAWDVDGTPSGTGNPWGMTLPVGTWTITATVTDSCSTGVQTCSASIPVTVNPNPLPSATALDPVVFCATDGESCQLDAGMGFTSYQWQLGGVDVPGATSQTYTASASGDYRVVVVDANGCIGTSTPVTLNGDDCHGAPPGEVSCQPDGDPPLLAVKGDTITVEKEPNATAYNVYADAIGSWYYPTSAKGSVCTITSWTDNGNGTVSFPFTIPVNSWIVVTASNPDGEGPVGKNTAGVEKTTIGAWELCGSAP